MLGAVAPSDRAQWERLGGFLLEGIVASLYIYTSMTGGRLIITRSKAPGNEQLPLCHVCGKDPLYTAEICSIQLVTHASTYFTHPV